MSENSAPRGVGDSRLRSFLRGWSLWNLPTRVRLLLLTVELTAVGLVTAGLVVAGGIAAAPGGWATAAAIVVIAGLHAEISLGAERMRRRIAETRYIDLSSVWTFAAALLLPPLLATTTVVLIYTHLYFRVFRPAGTPPHRQIYSTSTVVIGVHLVAVIQYLFGIGDEFSSPLGVLCLVTCLLAYTATNTLLVVSVIRLAQPGSKFLVILAGGDIALETATLSLGALVAAVIVPDHWVLLVLLLPPLVLLEQTTLIRQLETRAETDEKTGLLNPDTWRSRAQRGLAGAERDGAAAGVLILDLDYFKEVNDRYGHLVGDAVLQAVADVITSEVRDDDVAGRFGGEEFVIALSPVRPGDDGGEAAVREVGERIRRRVETLQVQVSAAPTLVIEELSVSIGAALYPATADELDTLLSIADEALYAAKRAGRNQVQVRNGTPPLGIPAPDHSSS
ncbi:hypothetical protein Ae717Ps2_6261 [Pseudonocardia sp. Ae717_Ps2]|nr:hypothetical protein Ae717Ps2_6261 [Pseudonocardia sp. Ae717_Ps2]